MTRHPATFVACLILCLPVTTSFAQDSADESASVRYPASYFAEFGAVSVNDMLNRIPGIALALDGNQVPSVGNNNNRGLGSESQILINGKRLAGKANETGAQLDRIPASQVSYIEIIRGTSGDLDVRNSGQLVNIVLLEVQASSSISAEAGAAYYHDGTMDPTGSLSYNGQRGSLNYLVNATLGSGYELQESTELSVLADDRLNETRVFDRQREQTNNTFNSNLVYQMRSMARMTRPRPCYARSPTSKPLRIHFLLSEKTYPQRPQTGS